MTKILPIRGTRDFIGDLARCIEFIQCYTSGTAKLFGFEPIDTPIFEASGVFKRAVGETSDIVGKEMYTFLDRGGEEITLRPEGTAPVVRALISNGLTQQLPLKYYYFGPMFRYERPQRGRYRQLHQFGVEFFGVDNPYADVETIALAKHILDNFPLNTSLHLNTIGDVASRNAYRDALVTYFTKYRTDLSPDSQQRLDKNPMRILDSKSEIDRCIASDAPKISTYLTADAKQFFAKVCDGLETLNIAYTIDQTIVRGLDYYTHTAFEFKSSDLGAQDTVIGGGRYDGLVQHMGGPNIPGVGWAMGVDRIALLLENRKFPKPAPVAILVIGDFFSEGIKLADSLRKQCIICEVIYKTDPSKAFKEADKLGATYGIIIGENEVASHTVKLKSFRLSPDHPDKERSIKISEIVQTLKGELFRAG